MSLRNKIIRLAYQKPELRKHLLPLVKADKTASINLTDTFEQFAENPKNSAKFLRDLKYHLTKIIRKEFGDFYETGANYRKGVIYFRIQDMITLVIKVNRDTEMIDFEVQSTSFKIESMDWTNASMKNVIDKVLPKLHHSIGIYTSK